VPRVAEAELSGAPLLERQDEFQMLLLLMLLLLLLLLLFRCCCC